MQRELAALVAWRDIHPWAASGLFLLCYIVSAALSLPVNVVLALTGGAVFGAWLGTILVVLSAATGSTLAMLSARWLLRDMVRHRFGQRLDEVERGLAGEGWVYLLSLRLMPVVPYTLVNLLFGLTRFPAWRFLLVSLLGMAPATLLYVLAALPLITRRLLHRWRTAKNAEKNECDT
jgi:uncharacterized membrane protein YdjX (TVP38/TMEM64 family)